jgi:hypothetical protein
MTDPSATGRYVKLKAEFIRILTDTYSARVKKLMENEEMGDKKPSQFYQHLRKLASLSTNKIWRKPPTKRGSWVTLLMGKTRFLRVGKTLFLRDF